MVLPINLLCNNKTLRIELVQQIFPGYKSLSRNKLPYIRSARATETFIISTAYRSFQRVQKCTFEAYLGKKYTDFYKLYFEPFLRLATEEKVAKLKLKRAVALFYRERIGKRFSLRQWNQPIRNLKLLDVKGISLYFQRYDAENSVEVTRFSLQANCTATEVDVVAGMRLSAPLPSSIIRFLKKEYKKQLMQQLPNVIVEIILGYVPKSAIDALSLF